MMESGYVCVLCRPVEYDLHNSQLHLSFIYLSPSFYWLMLWSIHMYTVAEFPSWVGLSVMSSLIARMFIFLSASRLLFIVLCQLLHVVVKLHSAQLLVHFNLVQHIETQH